MRKLLGTCIIKCVCSFCLHWLAVCAIGYNITNIRQREKHIRVKLRSMEDAEPVEAFKQKRTMKSKYFVGVTAALITLRIAVILSVTLVLVRMYIDGESQTPYPMRYDYRLPSAVRPEQYDIELYPILHSGSSAPLRFNGSVKIYLKFAAGTNEIIIHAVGLNLSDIRIFDGASASGSESTIRLLRHTELAQFEFHVLTFNRNFSVAGSYVLQMRFQGTILAASRGLFFRYVQPDATAVLVATHFQPTHARHVFPCFDEPRFKALFNLTLIRKAAYHALSNMPIRSTVKRNDGLEADLFEITPNMSSYLLTFVISNLSQLNVTDYRGRVYRAFAPSSDLHRVNCALQLAPPILQFFENWLNVSYVLSKLDFVSLPQWRNEAMENWGIITFQDKIIKMHPSVNTIVEKVYLEVVVAHELAHQWFGNLVTLEWWDDLWLNEGISSYMAFIGLERIYGGEQETEELFVNMYTHTALRANSDPAVQALDHPVQTPQEIALKFSSVNYGKAASLTRMMRYLITSDTFQRAITRYLNIYRFSNVRSADFLKVLTEQWFIENPRNAVDLVFVMQSWITNTGYPLVSVNKVANSSAKTCEIMLSQRRFGASNGTVAVDAVWNIPIHFLTNASSQSESAFKNQSLTWLHTPEARRTCGSAEVQGNTWLIANARQIGFYRVNYDAENWQLLINQLLLQHTQIDAVTRAQLVDDAFSFASVKILSYEIPLLMATYLVHERHFAAWSSAFSHFDYIESLLPYKSHCWTHFHEFLVKLIGPVHEYLMNLARSHSVLDQQLRHEIVTRACMLGIPTCISNMRRLFDTQNATGNFNFAESGSLLCAPASWDAWLTIHENLKTNYQSIDRLTILRRAIKCTRDATILKLFFETLEGDKASQELFTPLVSEAFAHAPGRSAGVLLLKNAAKALNRSKEEDDTLMNTRVVSARMILNVFIQFANTQSDLDTLQEVMVSLPRKLSIGQGLARIKMKVNTAKPIVTTICKWLASQSSTLENKVPTKSLTTNFAT